MPLHKNPVSSLVDVGLCGTAKGASQYFLPGKMAARLNFDMKDLVICSLDVQGGAGGWEWLQRCGSSCRWGGGTGFSGVRRGTVQLPGRGIVDRCYFWNDGGGTML